MPAMGQGDRKTLMSAGTFEMISRFAPTGVGVNVARVAPRARALAGDADAMMEKVCSFPSTKVKFAVKGVSHDSLYAGMEWKGV